MDEMAKVVIKNKIKYCSKCGHQYQYQHSGIYKCPNCGNTEMDDFGKVKAFLDKNGPAPAVIISDATGVRISVINTFLRQGRIEIPEGSTHYIRCENCGADIKFGRFCPDCARSLNKNLKATLSLGEVGDKPKRVEESGKMRFLDKKK